MWLCLGLMFTGHNEACHTAIVQCHATGGKQMPHVTPVTPTRSCLTGGDCCHMQPKLYHGPISLMIFPPQFQFNKIFAFAVIQIPMKPLHTKFAYIQYMYHDSRLTYMCKSVLQYDYAKHAKKWNYGRKKILFPCSNWHWDGKIISETHPGLVAIKNVMLSVFVIHSYHYHSKMTFLPDYQLKMSL